MSLKCYKNCSFYLYIK